MVLVVGGAGYIGSHMTQWLRNQGWPHLVFDNLEYGHEAAVAGSPFVKGDLRNEADLHAVFDAHPEIDVVMHFAAYTYVGESVTEPGKYWKNNTSAVLALLEIMREREIKKFIFSSTCATFGEPQRIPLSEDHPQNPISPYGQTKLAVEMILKDFDHAYGLRSVALRYFNAAGADPDGAIGEDHRPEAHLIPNAIFAATGKKPPLTIFGNDYDTLDGTCIRDYIHVVDLAQAHALAITHLRDGGDSRFYNLGNGNGYSVAEVIQTIEEVTGLPVPHTVGPRRPGDPARLIGSSAKVKADWNWDPQYPDLRSIIEHAWAWHSRHPNGYEDHA